MNNKVNGPARAAARKAASRAASPVDRGESTAQMEPLLISEGSRHRSELADLAVELAARASGFRRSLPTGIMEALAELVRSMNCYYSNLIEGHNTHPIDIERALNDDYSADPRKRNLQLEAKAHISVQAWIDDGGLAGRATTRESIEEIHRRFGELLPEEMLWVENLQDDGRARMTPGHLRERDVRVGRHIPVSPGALPRFMERFEKGYAALGRTDAILAAAGAHHRLLWSHPFLDGNGRVARLMSHAMLLDALGTGGVWSVARGLARNERAYKDYLLACDAPRRNDLDGRGSLSEEALATFTRFFLETCIDQIAFMESLVEPSRLRDRLLLWAREEIESGTLERKAERLLTAILYRGELPRSEIPELLAASERTARRVTRSLVDHGVVSARTSKAPLRLAFPAKLASRLMPGLFPGGDSYRAS